MSQNSIIAQSTTNAVVSAENAGILINNRFAEALSTLKVDCIKSDYKKIIAFNIVFNRLHVQHLYYNENPFSYIADIENQLLIDNNIYIRPDSANVIHPTIYIVIDNSLQDIESYVRRFSERSEILRVYVNIQDYLAYISVTNFLREQHPNMEIISLNDPPKTFNSNEHYNYQVSRTFVPWNDTLPESNSENKLPFLVFNEGLGNAISPCDSCLYALIKGQSFQTSVDIREQVGSRAAKLLLTWNSDIKTVKEHHDCCSEIVNYLILLKGFTTFGGRITKVTLDIKYQPNILSDERERPILLKGVRNLNLSEPSDDDVFNAIKKDTSYSKDRLFVLKENEKSVLCYAYEITSNIYLQLQDRVYFMGAIDNIIFHNANDLVLLTPLYGKIYADGMKSDKLKVPSILLDYIIRDCGHGSGWWASYNKGHTSALSDLLKFYTLDKLMSLNIYNPYDGFTSNSFSLNLKDTRWFS